MTDRSEVNKRYRERIKEKAKAELEGLRQEKNTLQQEMVSLKREILRLTEENRYLRRLARNSGEQWRRFLHQNRHFALLAMSNISEVLKCEETLSESLSGAALSPEDEWKWKSSDIGDLSDVDPFASILWLDGLEPILNHDLPPGNVSPVTLTPAGDSGVR